MLLKDMRFPYSRIGKTNNKALAIEGVCFAGKTTLAQHIFSSFNDSIIGPDFADLLTDDAPSPSPHNSEKEELSALKYFCELDKKRWESIECITSKPLIILDRSYHTLVAHVYAVDHIYGRHIFSNAVDIVKCHRPYIPMYTLLLKSAYYVFEHRYRSIQHSLNPLFVGDDYVSYFYEYFESSFIDDPKTIIYLRADQSATVSLKKILHLTEILYHQE